MLILTTFDLDQYVYAALAPGPAGSCSRTSPRNTWSRRSARSRAGDALLAPAITRRLVERYALRDTGAERLHRTCPR